MESCISVRRKEVAWKDLNETIDTTDLLAIVNSVHWYSHALREDGNVIRALDFEDESQRKKD